MIARLDPDNLPDSIAAAQQALNDSPAGTTHEWVIARPIDGTPIELTEPIEVDAGARAIVLRGEAGTRTQLEISTNAAAGILLAGQEVSLRELSVVVDGQDISAVSLSGTTTASISACSVVARGQNAIGVAIDAGQLAEAVDVEIDSVQATVDAATGLQVDGDIIRLHRVTVSDVVAAGTAVGVQAGLIENADDTVGAVSLSNVNVTQIRGDDAAGVVTRSADAERNDASSGPSGESIVLLDVVVAEVTARAGGAAIGVDVSGGGDVDVRGVSAIGIDGEQAIGATVLSAGQAIVSGGFLTDISGGDDGAVGLVVAASASTRPVAIDEVQVEAVHAIDHSDLVAGIRVIAPVSELAPWVGDASPPGVVELSGCVARRISGTAIDIDADLRDVSIRGLEVYAAAIAGSVRGERVIVSETTWHRVQTGVTFGPCSLTFVSSLVTQVGAGSALVRDPETETVSVLAVYGAPADPSPPLLPLPDGLPYADPGPAGVPAALADGRALPAADVDLRLRPPAALHDEAVATPGDPRDRTPQLGAHPPRVVAECDLRDPLEIVAAVDEQVEDGGPVVDRLARDGRGLLGVMQARADAALPGWIPGDAADLTTTLFELIANRLDRVSHRQDAALAEASMASARLRKSVEAHARLVDYQADPGLSATTVIELRIEPESYVRLALAASEADGSPSPHVDSFTLGAGSVIVNSDGTEAPVIVSTEHDLVWHDSLADIRLHAPIRRGEHYVELEGDLADLAAGRWLVIVHPEPDRPAHVVKATLVERGASTTLVYWDPRRVAPIDYPVHAQDLDEPTVVLANVAIAHHGVQVSHRVDHPYVDDDFLEELNALGARLDTPVPTRPDATLDLSLPLAAASRVATGWPFPGEGDRPGELDVAVEVDGEPFRLVDDIALEPGEVFCVVPSADGGSTVRVGQPGIFTGRTVQLTIPQARVGIGQDGNVAEHTLTSLLALGSGTTVLPEDISMSELRELLKIDNPVPGIGGRDPEPLERVRRAAPWTARRPVTAVTTADYETLLTDLDEVAGARARVLELGERRLVEVTLLLADEDTLVTDAGNRQDRGDVDLIRDAERLRRWSLARHRLDEIRLMGFDAMLALPTFVPLDIDVVVDARAWASAEEVYLLVTDALAGNGGLLDPDRVGLGGDVHVDEIMRSVLGVDGVASARVRRLRRLVPGAEEHAVDGKLPVASDEVAIIRRPYGDGADGVLTIEVCGGVR